VNLTAHNAKTMRVIAVVQIYLPYFLPRTPEWSEAPYYQHHFSVEGQLVNVHPRKANERLFPSPIDEQLAEAKIKIESELIIPVDVPREFPLRDRCLDRIEAQVFGEVTSQNECLKPEVNFAYRRLALGACHKFLYHCRVAAGDPDIGGLVWHYSFDEDRCFLTFPHSLVWFDADTKEPLRNDEGQVLGVAHGGSVRLPVRAPVELGEVQKSLSSGDQPSLTAALLVSAKERIMMDQLGEGVVNLASACEIATTQYIDRNGKSNSPDVANILKAKKQSFAERRYHRLPLHIDNQSLKADDPDAFDLVEKTYRTRNSVAHSGDLSYKDPVTGNRVVVTRAITINFFRGCERAISWIERL
jgi:hypothetical protein